MNILLFFFLTSSLVFAKPIVIGSKKFTESVILGEILRLGLSSEQNKVQHKEEIGGTTLLWNSLLSGDINLYPEYTGTIQEEILRNGSIDESQMRQMLSKKGIGMSRSLGFNNTYAVGMSEKKARELNIHNISDLKHHPILVFGWASEFMERRDGWPGLQKAYNLQHKNVRGIDHNIGYRALEAGEIDVIDLYSTDAEIPYYNIRVLKDDLAFFPEYNAVILYRLERQNEVQNFISKIERTINQSEMAEMNRLVKLEKKNASLVASDFLNKKLNSNTTVKSISRSERILQRSFEHFKLVSISLILSILVAIPLGIISARRKGLGDIILMIVSVIQTVPALALLVILIKPLTFLGLPGIGDTPAMIALFLYSLLPVLRNTFTGINQIPIELRETALVLNLSEWTKLKRIELPLAFPLIIAGIKTSLVLNIGFATLGALVGAGGYGQSILTGIRLDDYGLILEGAVPAALLAIIAQRCFEFFEERIPWK